MGRPRKKIGWPYDAETETFQLPDGSTITLAQIAQERQDKVYCRFDLSGEWSGWRIRGQFLHGPGGVRLRPETTRLFARWVSEAERNVSEPTVTRHRTTGHQDLRIRRASNINNCVTNALLRICQRA